jgi:hypothetical protein
MKNKNKKSIYKVDVRRYYFVSDTIEVEATSEEEARDLATIESDNKDYTGQLSLDEVVTEIL